MAQRFSKIIICTIAIMCLFCNALTAFAENGDVDFDFNIQPIEPTTQEQVIETEEETEKETEKPTQKPTQKPTEKPTKPQTTKAPQIPDNNNNSNNINNNVDANVAVTENETEETTEEESTEEPLPEGSYYVFLERNNGQRRLKTVMTGEGYLPEPEAPVRKGYVFVGWYRDSKFEKPWNFLTDKTSKEMTIYAKWETDSKTIAYDIAISDCVGGRIEVNPQKASLGEPVVITVVPEDGKRLVQGSLKVNGEPTDFFSFIMPKGNVTISAEFEDIPEIDEEENKKSKLPIIIGVGAVVIVILAVAIVIAKRRMDFNADLDPDEETTEEFDDEEWIDESIVVEAGFKEGKKVVESVEPDYGSPEADIEE